ncbi:hypothetical protein BV898_17361 [Hypsibius exemplaris]|uniref:Uncharacterized protein n=1 Tax=Hypsibius exemplaris TaxID=2072580 RepID=A0A9X6NGR2_HYPEX|nr:hypothetical protein BV898_17361 [Hypsibius exemplaris]
MKQNQNFASNLQAAVRMFSDGVAFTRSTPRSLYGLYTVWFFMVTVVGAVVCSLLPSYLTVSTAQLPFTDLQSFQRSGYDLVGPPSAFKILNVRLYKHSA